MPNQNMSDKRRQSRNLKTAVVLFGVVGGMVGLCIHLADRLL